MPFGSKSNEIIILRPNGPMATATTRLPMATPEAAESTGMAYPLELSLSPRDDADARNSVLFVTSGAVVS